MQTLPVLPCSRHPLTVGIFYGRVTVSTVRETQSLSGVDVKITRQENCVNPSMPYIKEIDVSMSVKVEESVAGRAGVSCLTGDLGCTKRGDNY